MAQTAVREASLKAAFIYNFTRYIEWENVNNDKEFVIGIVGAFAQNGAMREIANNYLVKNKKIVLRHFNKPEDIGDCHILFIPRNCPYPLQSILNKVGKDVLTISEEPGMARQGTAINFIVVDDKLKFEINLKALYSAGLRAGSQLLKLAVIVD